MREVGGRIESGERLKLFDKVCLVIVTAIGRDCRPLDLALLLDHRQYVLKFADAGEGFRTQTDNFFKLRNQVLLRNADGAGEVADRQKLRRMLQLLHGKRNQPVGLERAAHVTEQERLQQDEPFRY